MSGVGKVSEADRRRLAVLEELRARELDPNQYARLGELLAGIVLSPAHSPDIRRRAVRLVVERYSAEAPVWLGRAVPQTHEPEVREALLAHLRALADRRSVPWLILALAEADPRVLPSDTPVGTAVQDIAGQPLEQVLLSQTEPGGDLDARIAALGCLRRQAGADRAAALLRVRPGGDEFLETVRFWADGLGYVPANRPRWLMCHAQRLQLSRSDRERLGQRVQMLAGREVYRFSVGDSYLLLNLTDQHLSQTGGELAERLADRLASLSHTQRPPSYAGAPDDCREDFTGQRRLLSYADLLRMCLLLEHLAEPDNRSALRGRLAEDWADPTSEIGGLCFLEDRTVTFKLYAPAQRVGDHRYVESAALIADACLCVARWHCHAGARRSEDEPPEGRRLMDRQGRPAGRRDRTSGAWQAAPRAGPGLDDLSYVAYVGTPLVVLSRLNDNQLNVDYVNPEGIVVDLGNY